MKKRVVGLFYVDAHDPSCRKLARLCVESVRDAIPGAWIVHLTHPKTVPFEFADEVISFIAPGFGLMQFRMEHFCSLPYEEALFLDIDTVVQKDVWPVFDREFDIAIAKRSRKLVFKNANPESQLAEKMPYNTGVIFSKNRRFWVAVLRQMRDMSLDMRNWFGEQVAVAELIAANKFNVRELEEGMFNYTPSTNEEDVSHRAIVHYKGIRKSWMIRRFEREDIGNGV